MKRAVFLDRDGVLNEAVVREGLPYPPMNLRELKIVEDAPRSLSALKEAGFLLIAVTNQPDVARGSLSRETVDAIHARLKEELPLDEISVCCHDDSEECECRKPKPGMLLEAAERHSIALSSSFMVGDRWKDVEAGRRAGCRTLWIDRGYHEAYQGRAPHFTVRSLKEAVGKILSLERSPGEHARSAAD